MSVSKSSTTTLDNYTIERAMLNVTMEFAYETQE